MTNRQKKVLDLMHASMAQRFADNVWREKQPLPSIHELAARAQACLSQAYRHALIGTAAEAMRHAADAANLIGLMVVCGDDPRS